MIRLVELSMRLPPSLKTLIVTQREETGERQRFGMKAAELNRRVQSETLEVLVFLTKRVGSDCTRIILESLVEKDFSHRKERILRCEREKREVERQKTKPERVAFEGRSKRAARRRALRLSACYYCGRVIRWIITHPRGNADQTYFVPVYEDLCDSPECDFGDREELNKQITSVIRKGDRSKYLRNEKNCNEYLLEILSVKKGQTLKLLASNY
ncbi:P25 [Firespike leaf roll-associated virus]|nr:P25 [Firespike leaf roll-associated virus]